MSDTAHGSELPEQEEEMMAEYSPESAENRKNMGIVVLGASFVDIKGYPLSQYIPGGRNRGRVLQVHGGVSRNVVEDIANVGLSPTFIGVVDHSGIGTDVIDRLKKRGVNTDYMIRTDDGLGMWLAVFDNQGDVTASISKRPDLSPVSGILREHGEEIFAGADSIVVEIDMEEEQLNDIFRLAEKYGKKVYAVVSNMSIAMERRYWLKKTDCIVCNEMESAQLFSEEYDEMQQEELMKILPEKVRKAEINRMVVTMGAQGAVYVDSDGTAGMVPAINVNVSDTTGAGDAFFAGVAIGLTYGKKLSEAVMIGTRLASSVITTNENVCPSFRPSEFGINVGE